MSIAPGTWLRSPEPPPNHQQSLQLVPVDPGQDRLGPFRIAGVWQLTSPNSLFGSYSAMVEPAPGRLLAFSDRGEFIEFSVPGGSQGPVRIGSVPGGQARYKQYRDIEAATRDPQSGRIFLALEGRNAVARHGPDLALQAVRRVPQLANWGDNTGSEAMARLADGRFAVLCECTSGWRDSGLGPGLLFAGDPASEVKAQSFTFAGAEGYRPTDMALLPDDRVLVLVRRLTWPMPPRFKARLLLADPAEIRPGGTWRATELARIEAPLPVDNFEALAISQGPGGQISAWLMSDDNQALSQRSLLWKLDFQLADLPRKQKAPGSPDAPR